MCVSVFFQGRELVSNLMNIPVSHRKILRCCIVSLWPLGGALHLLQAGLVNAHSLVDPDVTAEGSRVYAPSGRGKSSVRRASARFCI